MRRPEISRPVAIDFDTYVTIARRLAGVATVADSSAVLAEFGLTPEQWRREASRWARAVRSDSVLRGGFRDLYVDPDPDRWAGVKSAGIREVRSGGRDATPWWALAVGALLLPFTIFQDVVPVAAWIAPIFLLRFVRRSGPGIALPAVAIVGYAASVVALRGLLPGPVVFLLAIPGLTTAIPYAADRFGAGRLPPFARSLVFPATRTALAFVFAFGPFGTMGMTAYSQAHVTSLVQIVSVTGIWGLEFLVAWTAPVLNGVWEHRALPGPARRPAVVWALVLGTVLLLGGARVAFAPAPNATVQVAGLAPSRSSVEALEAASIPAGPRDPAVRATIVKRHLDPLLEDLFDRTRRAAAAGSSIVVWSEAAATVFVEDLPALIERAGAEARAADIYLQVGVVVLLPSSTHPTVENRAIMVSPAGDVVWNYEKATVPLSDGNAPGPGVVPFADTPYGRMATVICFDADFPGLVRQAGRNGVDILLVPASDFGTAGEPHARMSVLRAVENGMSVFRPTRRGVSIAVDAMGRTLGVRSDYESDAVQTLVAVLPTGGIPTLSPLLGDAVAFAALGASAGLLSWNRTRMKSGPGRGATPDSSGRSRRRRIPAGRGGAAR